MKPIVHGMTAAAALAALAVGTAAHAADKITISAGPRDGVYHAAGQAICRALLADDPTTSCLVAESPGSTMNLLTLGSGAAQFAFVQSDVQHDAVRGLGLFATFGSDKSLRSVVSLHEEAFTVVVRSDDPAKSAADLKGRRFSVGGFGTGLRETAEHLIVHSGWSKDDRRGLREIPAAGQAEALCSGQIDGAAYLTGHPSRAIIGVMDRCAVRMIPLPEAAIRDIVKTNPYHVSTYVPGGLYAPKQPAITTIAVHLTIVTKANTPDRLVGKLVNSLVKHVATVRTAAPSMGGLQTAGMGTAGLTAPLHPGAREALHKAGIATEHQHHRAPPPETTSSISGWSTTVQEPRAKAAQPQSPSYTQSLAPLPSVRPSPRSGQWYLSTDDQQALSADGNLGRADTSIEFKLRFD